MKLSIIFDGPPGAVSGRFVEVEDENGQSMNAGTWRERSAGLWSLDIDTEELERKRCRCKDECRDLLEEFADHITARDFLHLRGPSEDDMEWLRGFIKRVIGPDGVLND